MNKPSRLRRLWDSVKMFAVRSAHVASAASYGFWQDDCYNKASTLTFYTVQSIVPLLAALLGIAKGFGLDEYLRDLLISLFQDQREMLSYVVQIADSMLANIRSGVVAGVGAALLFWTSINLLTYIEITLNDIWKAKAPRDFFQKFKDFLATLIICPFVLVISSSLTVYFKSQIGQLHAMAWVKPLTVFLHFFIPLLLSCLLFFLLYILIPKTRLSVWPRIVAAIMAGVAFQVWQVVYINFQAKIFNYNAVYGAFSIIPLFLIWLQISWLIALAGAEIAAHLERIVLPERAFPGKQRKIDRRTLGLLILYYCIRNFHKRMPPLRDFEFANLLKTELGPTQEILETLRNGKILASVNISDREIGYLPAGDPNRITLKNACDVVDHSYDQEVITESSDALERVESVLNGLEKSLEHSDANIKLNDLVRE